MGRTRSLRGSAATGARAAPTVLVLEDVHWADECALDVLRLLGRCVQSLPVLLIVSYYGRPILGRFHPCRLVAQELGSEAAVCELEARSALRRRRSQASVGPHCFDASALYQNDGGNPFFGSRGSPPQARRSPRRCAMRCLALAARLAPAGRTLLEAVAVTLQPTERSLLEAVAGERSRCPRRLPRLGNCCWRELRLGVCDTSSRGWRSERRWPRIEGGGSTDALATLGPHRQPRQTCRPARASTRGRRRCRGGARVRGARPERALSALGAPARLPPIRACCAFRRRPTARGSSQARKRSFFSSAG